MMNESMSIHSGSVTITSNRKSAMSALTADRFTSGSTVIWSTGCRDIQVAQLQRNFGYLKMVLPWQCDHETPLKCAHERNTLCAWALQSLIIALGTLFFFF